MAAGRNSVLLIGRLVESSWLYYVCVRAYRYAVELAELKPLLT